MRPQDHCWRTIAHYSTLACASLTALVWPTPCRRFYRERAEAELKQSTPQSTRRLFLICGPRRVLKPAKFFPWPKSLLWPTPLFFVCCVFITGAAPRPTSLTFSHLYLLLQPSPTTSSLQA